MVNDLDELLKLAVEASKKSYSPYSRIKVGASLLSSDGKVYSGSNIENSSYGLSICAERVALFNAVFDGAKKFTALAVYSQKIVPVPCGACLQVLSEFFEGNEVIIYASDAIKNKLTFKELLPVRFNLGEKNEKAD
ncbi:MAG: cytidine deaminase [Actinobacteria bacterium]|nr:cytidine deaminase [Actinomycetota bacterium]